MRYVIFALCLVAAFMAGISLRPNTAVAGGGNPPVSATSFILTDATGATQATLKMVDGKPVFILAATPALPENKDAAPAVTPVVKDKTIPATTTPVVKDVVLPPGLIVACSMEELASFSRNGLTLKSPPPGVVIEASCTAPYKKPDGTIVLPPYPLSGSITPDGSQQRWHYTLRDNHPEGWEELSITRDNPISIKKPHIMN